MPTRTLARTATVALAAAAVVGATTTPATASSWNLSRTTGRAATTNWLQYADLTAAGFGNWHSGFLNAFETSTGSADVFAFIDDFLCAEGQQPDPGSHGETGCEYVGSRQLEGYGIAFTMDNRLGSATLQGTLVATQGGGHGEPGNVIGQVPADFRWTGYGDTVRSTSTYRYSDSEGNTYSERLRSTRREATMSGRLGPMLFEQAAQASGAIEKFTVTTKSSSR
jgi:hypothetical protein